MSRMNFSPNRLAGKYSPLTELFHFHKCRLPDNYELSDFIHLTWEQKLKICITFALFGFYFCSYGTHERCERDANMRQHQCFRVASFWKKIPHVIFCAINMCYQKQKLRPISSLSSYKKSSVLPRTYKHGMNIMCHQVLLLAGRLSTHEIYRSFQQHNLIRKM